MTDRATKRNHGCFTILLVRMVIAIGAAILYLRALTTPERRDPA